MYPQSIRLCALFLMVPGIVAAEDTAETAPPVIKQVVAIENVCAWPNLTLLDDGTIIAILFNQPSHGQMAGDVDCWASRDGLAWEKRGAVTGHDPNTVRMNHAAGLAANGDLVVLCSGWSNEKQAERPKQADFRDAILRPWVLRSSNGGRSWEKREAFPAPEAGWSEYIPFGDIWAGKDGALHAACYHGVFVDPTKSTRMERYRTWHFRSNDDGLTWKAVSLITPVSNETALPIGEVDIFPGEGQKWLAVGRTARTILLRSDDNGMTWSEPQPVTGSGEINAHLNRLEDGRLLLTYGVRTRGNQGVCAKLSGDGGNTWGDSIRLANSESSDCGYPSSVQLPNGSIVTAWYSRKTPERDRYQMGATVWRAPPAEQ